MSYIDRVTFGKHLRRGLVARKSSHVIRKSELSSPPNLLGRGKGIEIEFNHQWPVI